MTPAAWIALVGCVLSIVGSGLAAWVAVRVGQARDGQRIAALEPELIRTREAIHDLRDTWNPILAHMQGDIERLKGHHEEAKGWREMVIDLVKMVVARSAE